MCLSPGTDGDDMYFLPFPSAVHYHILLALLLVLKTLIIFISSSSQAIPFALFTHS